MDFATLLTVTQTVVQLLDSSVMKEFGGIWNLRSELSKMKATMSTIKAVLINAEEQEKHRVQRSEVDNDWLEKLRDAVYEADDLFDRVSTLAQRHKLDHGIGGKVYLLLSRPSFVLNAIRDVKKIRESLDAVAKDRRDFGSYSLLNNSDVGEGSKTRKLMSKESHSYVRDEDVVGRDDDKRALIDMLLESRVDEDVSCVTIVGIGGLGKTTLAQLAYNDERILGEFSLRLWVCVSQKFVVYNILHQILDLMTGKKGIRVFGMEKLRIKFQEEIKGKRYLLVLDDLWNENREEWLKLRELLMVGGKGSKILATTRSHMVATAIGNGPTYELEGLSLKNSWILFEKLAFEGKRQADAELVEIGKEIVRRCVNIPLAIRIIASLLYGQGINKWRSFRDIDLIQLKQDGVLPVLKLSYYHLEPPLKSCFNYCALFPRYNVIDKETSIRLWIAQGFIVPSYGLSVEETAEEYFLTLLNRGFFQDAGKNNHGELVSCNIPAVMLNLAEEASKLEISIADSNTSQVNEKIRHLMVVGLNTFVASLIQGNANCPMKSLRTFQCQYLKAPELKNIMSKGRCFRVLDLQSTNFKRLPSFNKLLQIRYLDLSYSRNLQVLPDSLAKLHNLQTLLLNSCYRLKELPRGMRKLVNLKHLEISGCNSLIHMPPRFNCLTNLRTLTMFVAGQGGLFKKGGRSVCSNLNDLKSLINLKGSLTIMLRKVITNTAIVEGARYLTSMEHLSDICLDWSNCEDNSPFSNHEVLLKGLQPPYNLKKYRLKGYPGMRFPSWDSLENSRAPFSNLGEISLSSCTGLLYLPSMSQLPYLKIFELASLGSLEYIENNNGNDIVPPASARSRSITSDDSLFFPSLEELRLKDLQKLKGWWWRSSGKQQQSELASMSFPRLSVLQIHNCPILTSIPLCHNVEDMELIKFDESFSPFNISNKKAVLDASSSSSYTNNLKRLTIDNVGYLNSWPSEYLQQLQYMEIQDARLQNLSTVGEVFQWRVTSLLSLDISCCSQLRSLSEGGLEHLTALETLRLYFLKTLCLNGEHVMPWRSLCHSLRSIEFVQLPNLKNLPKGMQYLTTLRSLKISECSNLEALPEWLSYLSSLQSLSIRGGRVKALPKAMQDLTSLRSLEITSCLTSLKARCQIGTGEDWPKIQHIPRLTIWAG